MKKIEVSVEKLRELLEHVDGPGKEVVSAILYNEAEVWITTRDKEAVPIPLFNPRKFSAVEGIGVIGSSAAFLVHIGHSVLLPWRYSPLNDKVNPCVFDQSGNPNEITNFISDAGESIIADALHPRFPLSGHNAVEYCIEMADKVEWVLPTVSILYTMAKNIEQINKALTVAGGAILPPFPHWTCNLNPMDQMEAITVDVLNTQQHYCRHENWNLVRPIANFEIENYKFLRQC